MSRGPGKWQRLILDEVHSGRWTYLLDLLADTHTRSEYQALYRAARTLDEAGRISLWRYTTGTKKLLVGPPGAAPAKRPPQ